MFRKGLSFIIFSFTFVFLFTLQTESIEKFYKKDNVSEGEASKEIGKAILSIGFSMPAIGNDPCQGMEKTIGGMKKYSPKRASEVTGLPTKPSTSVGRQGQIMEGESSQVIESYSSQNVCYEGYDREGKKCVEAIANSDGTTTFKNTSDKSCIIQIGDNHTLSLAPKSEITTNTQKEKNNPLTEGLGKARSWLLDKLPDWTKSSPSSPKGSGVGVRGNCDPEGIAGGCIINAGSGLVLPTLPEYLSFIDDSEKKGLATKLKWSRINPSPDSSVPSEGPKPTETYPSQSTKSGYEREKSSKTDKGGTIINPSDSSSSRGGRNIDFCGRNLPTPEQAASMGFNPAKITDPANRDWTGRIEQTQQERSLIWSKSMRNNDGSIVKIERRYVDGKLSSINYTFYNKDGKQIGIVSYDSKARAVKGERK
ncbi:MULTISPECIES: hypothetical protein [Thermodesulfovibrio]|jgi:hypothetical protein|uniref:hypothetical protein n=1 Tax=Thermodesulfovibrio TaxID=28261 RepID=UPI0026372311|nr:hypothetical protein [Thermodesulfovibrio sp.]